MTPRYEPPTDPAVPDASPLYRGCAWLAFTMMSVQRWRFEVEGLAHVPARGGAVLAADHTSFFDFFTVGRAPYYAYGRPARILAKASLFSLPVFGGAMRSAGHIPVHRGAGASALRSAVGALRAGELVLVLPEQTISPSFEPMAFKSGAARMAAAAGVPLVPAASWGSHRFHTVGRWPRWRWRLPVGVAYGAPLRPDPDADLTAVTEQLRERIATLHDRLVEQYPDGTPSGAWWVPARFGGGAPTPQEAEQHVTKVRSRFRRAG